MRDKPASIWYQNLFPGVGDRAGSRNRFGSIHLAGILKRGIVIGPAQLSDHGTEFDGVPSSHRFDDA